MSFCKKIVLGFLIHCFIITTASGTQFPRGCEVKGFAYQDNDLILNEHGQQSFYLIKNHSNLLIELEHYETKNVFMSPKLHTKLDPAMSAAFASDVPLLYFKCYTQEGDHPTIVPCKDVLDICQYPRVKFALSNMGNYWVSTNKDQAQVIKDASIKGIWLHW